MKILLVRPNFGSYYQITPPLSLGYLSGSLKSEGYSGIDFIDASLTKLTPKEVISIFAKWKCLPEIIGIQVYTGAQNWTKNFSGLIRKKYGNKIKVVVGGPHISALKELALEYMGVDFGIVGEGETSIVQFARFVEGKITVREVEGLLYKQGKEWKSARVGFGFVHDPNKIPFPDWELLKPQNYFPYMESVSFPLKGKRPAPIITSRGCPYQCTFCSSGITGRRIMRYRSAENVAEEIKYLKEKHSVNEIFFSDDNLTMDAQRAEKIFDLMIKEKLDVHWRAPNGIRVDSLNESLISKMASSGGYFVGLGVETGNSLVMERIKKKVDLIKVKNTVELLKKYKIKTSGFFMCGLRGETKDEMQDSINFALSVPFDRIQVCNFVPYPGSEDFDLIYERSDQLKYGKNLLKFQKNGFVPAFQSLSLKDIYKIQRRFLLKFYLRPKQILQIMLNFKVSQLIALFRHPFVRKWFSSKKEWYDQ